MNLHSKLPIIGSPRGPGGSLYRFLVTRYTTRPTPKPIQIARVVVDSGIQAKQPMSAILCNVLTRKCDYDGGIPNCETVVKQN